MNRQIRIPQVRVIGADGSQLGIMDTRDAQNLANEQNLDLVEVAPLAKPPVCKIIDYGKFRFDQTKREKESKKTQHQVKIKEIKLKPNIDDHDLNTKLKRSHQFLEKGYKVKVTCMFRGREMAYPENGRKVVQRLIDELKDIGTVEAPLKMMGRSLFCVLAPSGKK
ncbi:MAG: Translation initiation factor IF-3 [Chlamydiales bacterium]|nr:Translation initiation factor IF-3 [Chlamydiales bacterium]MCH9620423.1 Translation initiation factor IF-3 [Chlamydiales bacterium]MCH9622931.1 Translation initiation factor IF-3 [Chlamydiales bacterium]